MKKTISCVAAIMLLNRTTISYGCPLCNRQVRDGIYNSQFYPNLLTMLSAFFVLALLVIMFSVLSTRRHTARGKENSPVITLSPVPLATAAIVLGVGIGGFLDGIFLHQIFQTHEMLSNRIPTSDLVGKSINMFWDGIFHFFCLLVVMTGVVLLWKLSRRKDADLSGRLLAGGMLTGWGVFNIVEGVIDHHWLKLHNVVERAADHDTGNYIFLIGSLLLVGIGVALIKKRPTIITK